MRNNCKAICLVWLTSVGVSVYALACVLCDELHFALHNIVTFTITITINHITSYNIAHCKFKQQQHKERRKKKNNNTWDDTMGNDVLTSCVRFIICLSLTFVMHLHFFSSKKSEKKCFGINLRLRIHWHYVIKSIHSVQWSDVIETSGISTTLF